jgi:glycerophosphoryl diester phosphodiesterase
MIFAHRGASHYRPENTLSAYRYAYELGADGIEVDVQLSRDGVPVLYHDWTFDKITGEQNLVTEMSSADIKKLDAGSVFSDKFKGEQVPFLDELLSVVPDTKYVNIEIKKTAFESRPLEEMVVEAVYRHHLEDRVIFSSFNHNSILKVKEISPAIKRALLFNSMPVEPEKYAQQFGCWSFHPAFVYVNEKDVEKFHKMGIKIFPWVVDIPYYADKLFEMGVDGLITNIPDLFIKKK